mmetsp:Transcript_40182/g.48973  ORF Transcript_40182/g.48973 Transcript_40182/m.48973 type:complete len:83 (-) Transcript_40182:705-953(-)
MGIQRSYFLDPANSSSSLSWKSESPNLSCFLIGSAEITSSAATLTPVPTTALNTAPQPALNNPIGWATCGMPYTAVPTNAVH